MIDFNQKKPLKDRVGEIIVKLQDHDDFYCHNEEVLDIYEGNLLEYVEHLMGQTLDKRYFQLIKHRILPINFIQKIVDKLAKSYGDEPLRKSEDQDFVDFYVRELDLDSAMMLAEEYSYLNRGYALKPKLTNAGRLKMDVLPYDKFFVIADDSSDQMTPTVFVEFMGKTERQKTVDDADEVLEVDWYIAYTDEEIIAFDEGGTLMPEVTEALGDRNPIGCIPFVYGNRSKSNIVPKQDTDFLRLAKILPLMLSDVNGAIMFQCFTLIYGIDVEFNDATMSPNAIWDLSSKSKSEQTAQIGTLQPTVDSTKALEFFKSVLGMWLDSKGIDAGSIMQLDSQAMASGLSKAMDELDTTEARKKSIKMLAKEEKMLFKLLAKLNNYWLTLPEARDLKLVKVNEEKVCESITVEFKEPMPKLDFTVEVDNSIKMIQNGLSYREKEIRRLHPYAEDDEINQIFFEYGTPRYEIGSKEVEEGVEPKEEEETTPLIEETTLPTGEEDALQEENQENEVQNNEE